MELIPSLCMMIRHLQYYSQLSTICQSIGYSQSIASQTAVCELPKCIVDGHRRYELSQCNILQNSARSRKYPRHDVMSLSQWCWIIMELIPFLCMMIEHLQYHSQLSTNCHNLGYSQSIANQAAVCELDTIWPRDSNRRAYYFQMSTLYQILGDSQWIINQATICELNAIWPRDSNPRAYYCQLSTR